MAVDEKVGPSCKNCTFWDNHTCRKNPPTVIAISDFANRRVAQTVWPHTDPYEFCGEFVNKG